MNATDLVVRAFQPSDEPAVDALWRAVFPDSPAWNESNADIRRKLAVQPDLFLVAELEGRIVGTTMAGYDGHRGWVHLVAVWPHVRRHGIGRALMTEASGGSPHSAVRNSTSRCGVRTAT